MINHEVYMKTSAEVCSQIASYFDVVDSCIATSDTNKQYSINPQTSYSPSPPIKQGSYTSVIISPNTHNTADIYNGFIRADLKVTMNINEKIPDLSDIGGYPFNKIWFGFKDARDAIEKYEIVANGITIYTQNFGCEESFLTACCANETTKRADVYSKARHKDIWNNNFATRCGIVINWPKDDLTATFTIHLKIDLRRFLPLSNIKYLPAFAGKLELRLYFSCAGMLCCPCGPSRSLLAQPSLATQYTFYAITNEFTPVGDDVKIWISSTSANSSGQASGKTDEAEILASETPYTIYSGLRKFQVYEYEITECSSIIPCFGINNEIYQQLVQRYSNPQHPLTFPTQTLSFYTCTQALKQIQDKTTVTVTPRFVDSIFCLFPLHQRHHTYFKNPLFKHFQLNCGGYGNIPAKSFGTDGEYPEFIEYCQNAMNMNGEQTGFNKEVIASLCNVSKPLANITGLYPNDRTSFFIGFATETDGTYQQGLTSLSPINFEIIVTQEHAQIKDPNDKSENYKKHFSQIVDTPPILGLLVDASISILVQPNGMPPLVRIGNYDITTPE